MRIELSPVERTSRFVLRRLCPYIPIRDLLFGSYYFFISLASFLNMFSKVGSPVFVLVLSLILIFFAPGFI